MDILTQAAADYNEYMVSIERANIAARTMVNLAHSEGGVEDLVSTEEGLNVWQGLCTNLFDFLRTCTMIEGAALIHKISRHGKLSFTKILPYIEEPEGDMTFTRYREYLRHMILIEDKVERRVQEIRFGKEAKDEDRQPSIGDIVKNEEALNG